MTGKSYEELGIENYFIFGEIFRDEERCKKLLEMILQVKIKKINYIQKEKVYDNFVDAKSIRIDVYVDDEEGTVYDIEMQTNNTFELPLRSRYYQSMFDIDLLSKGKSYRNLKKGFVIFICTFDPFGDNRYMYTFESRCRENNDIVLGDNVYKIFLNTKGLKGKVSKELKNFLSYIETRNVNDEFTKDIDKEVRNLRNDKEARLRYMSLQLYIDDERDLGRQEGERIGLQKGEQIERISLIRKQLNKGKDIAFIVDIMEIDTEFVESVAKLIKDNPDMNDSDIMEMMDV